MAKGKNKSKFQHRPNAIKSAAPSAVNCSDSGSDTQSRKLTKQEKRNLKKKEKLLAEAGQCVNACSKATTATADPVAPHHQTTTSLQTSVYKRVPVYPRSYPMASSALQQGFVEAHNKNFNKIIETCYEGFAIQNSDAFPREFHDKFQKAMKGLETLGFYQFDMTQPAGLGTKVARTFVTRCIVGEPGMTYKYLGLRMFGFPWVLGATGSNEHTVAIGELNEELIRRSNTLNAESGKTEYGSSNFNLTLINRCFPEGEEVVLKNEPMFEKDKLTVSWHADSCLDHYSTIAVYHFNEQNNCKKFQKPWRIALRTQINAEGPQQGKAVPDLEVDCPPVALALPQECCYYLLDDFNHHHQHAVLVGGSHRFASTHRVSRREGHTYQYLHQKIQSVLNEKLSADRKTIRRLFLVALELEFEWIRQFYIQGRKHHDLHVWWHKPMVEFKNALISVEQRLIKIFKALCEARLKKNGSQNVLEETRLSKDEMKMKKLVESVEPDSLQEMLTHLNDRLEKRNGWEAREKDPVYATVDPSAAPMDVPLSGVYELWDKVLPVINEDKSSEIDSKAIASCKNIIKLLQQN